MYNKHLMNYLEEVLKQPAIEIAHYPYRKSKTNKTGLKAVWFRWWYGQCLETHKAFWTMRTDDDFKALERKGWQIYETIEHDSESPNILFLEIGNGLQQNIPQLSSKTTVIAHEYTSFPLRVAVHKPFNIFDNPITEQAPVVDIEYHHLEWMDYYVEDARDMFQYHPTRYRFCVAYNGIHDQLYIDYRG
jgi:hypothetical protein